MVNKRPVKGQTAKRGEGERLTYPAGDIARLLGVTVEDIEAAIAAYKPVQTSVEPEWFKNAVIDCGKY